MKNYDKIDVIAKTIDSLYKKLIVLLAIAGGFGAYAIDFLQKANWVGYLFAVVFIIVTVAIFITYTKMNIFVKKLERIADE